MIRNINIVLAGALVAAATVYAVAASAEPARYDVGPPPAWVQDAPASSDSPQPSTGAKAPTGGTEYRLNDLQVRVEDGWAEYGHYILRVTNASAVSDNSNININFRH